MLALILPHGDDIGLIEQDVGGHEGGIGKEAGVDVVGVLGGLVLELGHAAKLAEHGIAVEDPGQLRVGGHHGLDKEDAPVGVNAAGDELGKQLHRAAAQSGRILPQGDGVLIHYTVDAVILILIGRPVPECPHIVAQMDVAAGLDAAEADLTTLYHVKHSFSQSQYRLW